MNADDGHFEYRQIVYFIVQITMDFLCHKHFVNIINDYVITKKFNNFVIIKN